MMRLWMDPGGRKETRITGRSPGSSGWLGERTLHRCAEEQGARRLAMRNGSTIKNVGDAHTSNNERDTAIEQVLGLGMRPLAFCPEGRR